MTEPFLSHVLHNSQKAEVLQHAAMAGGKHEAVTVDPGRILRSGEEPGRNQDTNNYKALSMTLNGLSLLGGGGEFQDARIESLGLGGWRCREHGGTC